MRTPLPMAALTLAAMVFAVGCLQEDRVDPIVPPLVRDEKTDIPRHYEDALKVDRENGICYTALDRWNLNRPTSHRWQPIARDCTDWHPFKPY